jgi:hypothetical protein
MVRSVFALRHLILASCVAAFAISGFLALHSRRGDGALVPRQRAFSWKGDTLSDPTIADHATVRFQLDNIGVNAVRVLGIESGCGCATPVVEPEIVTPGGHTTVTVSAISIPVGRKVVPIIVHTDSLTQPDVELTFVIEGTRKPPFLFRIEGDLSFRGKFGAGLGREFEVVTVEPAGCRETPDISTSLSFLRLTQVGLQDEPYDDPASVLRRRTWKLEFTQKPPSAQFSGVVTARDPWHAGASQTLIVQGQFDDSNLRVAPSNVTLRYPEQPAASLMVISDEPISELEFHIDDAPGIPLLVALANPQRSGRVQRVNIRLSSGVPVKSGETTLRIRIPGHGVNEERIVPVAVRAD